jgi:metallophosphoesterase (TIGR00282 family)
MRILFFGDIVGRIGRQGLAKILPSMKIELQPDLILANVENAAHGAGISEKILNELRQTGIDFFTSGNHILAKPEAVSLLAAADSRVIRPANFPPATPGQGYKIIEVGSRRLLIINLLGQVFIKEECTNPFFKFDEIMANVDLTDLVGVIVDFHAEATSEKTAFAWYVDGRASAVLGTHTHIPTADLRILPAKTAYVTDVGMVGALDSVIGNTKEPIIEAFIKNEHPQIDIPKAGEVVVGAVFLELDPLTKKITNFYRVDRKIKV